MYVHSPFMCVLKCYVLRGCLSVCSGAAVNGPGGCPQPGQSSPEEECKQFEGPHKTAPTLQKVRTPTYSPTYIPLTGLKSVYTHILTVCPAIMVSVCTYILSSRSSVSIYTSYVCMTVYRGMTVCTVVCILFRQTHLTLLPFPYIESN